MVTALVAWVGGFLFVGGVLLAVAGWHGYDVLPTRPVRARRSRPASGWPVWRWPVAAVAGVIAWAVTSWPVAGILTSAAVVGLPILLGTGRIAKTRIARVEAIEDWTRRMSDVLTTGVGLEQAITATARTCPPALRTEVTALAARLAARWPAERALRAFADQVADPAVDLVVAALVLASLRRGSGLASVLAGVAGSVGEDVAARRRIEAERARPRTTAKAVTVITAVVLAVGAMTGDYLAPYSDALGQVVLAIVGAGFAGCLLWMRRLTLPPAPVRHLAQETS